MKLHALKNNPGSRHRTKRVGRGESSGWGKTAGRGHKGQHARAGSKTRPTFEGGQMPLIRRLPKRGFNQAYGTVFLPVNVGALEAFDAGADVSPGLLRAAGLAKGSGPVKILGQGTLTRKLTVKAHAFSAAARKKIEEAGGACDVLND